MLFLNMICLTVRPAFLSAQDFKLTINIEKPPRDSNNLKSIEMEDDLEGVISQVFSAAKLISAEGGV
jgi:hypothetical protein